MNNSELPRSEETERQLEYQTGLKEKLWSVNRASKGIVHYFLVQYSKYAILVAPNSNYSSIMYTKKILHI